jgi:transposase
MARVTRAVSHLSAEEIKQRLKHDSRPWCRQRWLIIYNALIEPRKAEEIAKHCGVSKATVHQVISTYNRLGVEAVETAGRGGRRHEYLSVEEEKQFLAPFFARARSGEIATATEVKLASARTGWSRGGREHDLPFARSAWMAQTHAAPETPQRE